MVTLGGSQRMSKAKNIVLEPLMPVQNALKILLKDK